MKALFFNISILILMAMSISLGYAANYHVSNEIGDDSRSFTQAQNPNTPWKSIKKVNAVFSSLNAGDKILFRRGEAYFGTILMNNSGTPGNPITIGAYGSGENPVITGFANLTDWKSIGNGIYESGHAQLQAKVTNMVSFNNKDREMGRYPNSDSNNKGYLTYESTSWNSITDNELKSWPNWTGGEVVIRKIYWILDRHTITSHSGNTINYATNRETNFQPKSEFGYFIQNHVRTLDQLGEWYYDSRISKLKVFFGNESPSNHIIEVAALDVLLTQEKRVDHVVIENLHFRGANTNAIDLSTGSYVTIKNTQVEMAGENGISAEGNRHLRLEANELSNIHNSGIELKSCDDAIIVNNKINDILLYPGMGKSGNENGFGIYTPNDNNLIEGNEIINIGYIGIRFGGNNSVVKNNFINHFNKTKNDGGGIYTYTGNSNETFYNRKVIGNVILNGYGVVEGTNIRSALVKPQSEGIYLDDNSSGVEVAYNTISNVSSKGIYLHNARQNNIHHNTVYNSGHQLYFKNDNLGADIRDNVIANNLFFSQNGEQNNLYLSSIKNDLGQMATFRDNVYASPLTDNFRIINKYNVGTSYEVTKLLDLEGWKNLYGKDARSKIHPIEIPAYEVNGIIGNNKYNNEGFDKDVNYVTVKNAKTQWAGSSKLDGGALRVTASGTFEVNVNVGKVVEGSNYLISFSGIGNKAFAGKAYFREKSSPWRTVSAVNTIEFSSERNEYEILLNPAISSEETVLMFKFENISYADFQMDNLKVHEADLLLTDPEEKIFFAYNEERTEKSISLPGEYIDMDNKSYSGSIKLAPFSSIILIKTSKGINQPSPMENLRLAIPENGSEMVEGADLPVRLNVEEGRQLEIEKVAYYYCGKLITTESEDPMACTWENVPYGSHYIYAEALDIYGRSILSDSVFVEIKKQNVLPVITLNQPLGNMTINSGESVIVKGSAIDLDGDLSQVNLLVNGSAVASASGSPFEFSWTSTQEGTFTLGLQAVDNENGEGLSDEVNVTVSAKEILPEITPGDLGKTFSLFVNLGLKKGITYEGTNFEGEQAVTDKISGNTYTYSNTKFQEPLFQTERNGGEFVFRVPVPNGTYTVRTFHNELFFGQVGPSARAGRRVFDILLEGEVVKDNLDLFVENNNDPLTLTFENVEVTDGKLDLGMKASENRASISGFAILSQSNSSSQGSAVYLNTSYQDDVTFQNNVYVSGGEYINSANAKTYTNVNAGNEKIFQSERYATVLDFLIPVENGTYTVKTYHNELYFGKGGPSAKAGNRVFDILLEDKVVKDDFDLFLHSNNESTILTFEEIQVSDGVLNLQLIASANNASISGISIIQESKDVIQKSGTDHMYFLNTGGDSDVKLNGITYLAETNEQSYYNKGAGSHQNKKADVEAIFQTERWGKNLKYAIPVPNGTYTVFTMHNELWFGYAGGTARVGQRVYDIALQGETLKSNFDLYKENNNNPTLLSFENITVTDGILTLEMTASVNNASISGIAIIGDQAKNINLAANLRRSQSNYNRGYKEMFNRGYKEMDVYTETVAANEIRIFPNPAKGRATLEINAEIGKGRVLIHNMSGQLVSHFDLDWIKTAANEFNIPLDNLSKGVYLVSISNEQTIINKQRLIVNP